MQRKIEQSIIDSTQPTFLPQSIVKMLKNQLYQFESKFIQRIKQTPFVNAEVLVVISHQNKQKSLFFNDPIDLPLSMILQPRLAKSTQNPNLESKPYFPQQQIIKIVGGIAKAIYQLQNQRKQLRQFRGQGYGDITTDTICYNKNLKIFQLMNPAFVIESAYLKAFLGKRFSLLSPEQLIAMAEATQIQQKYPDTITPDQKSIKSDIFALGLTVLECCTLLSSSQIYCPQTYNIFDFQLKKRLEIVQEVYNKQLRALIQKMIAYDQMDRIGIQEIIQEISKFKQKGQIQQNSRVLNRRNLPIK